MLPGLNRTASVIGSTVILGCFLRQHGHLLDDEILFLINYSTIWSPIIRFSFHFVSSVDKKIKTPFYLYRHKLKKN